MARSSTFVVHVGYHCCIAFMKSRAGSVLRTEGREERNGWMMMMNICPQNFKKKNRFLQKRTLSMIKPRFIALTFWEPSIGSTDTNIHDEVEFYIQQIKKERKRKEK